MVARRCPCVGSVRPLEFRQAARRARSFVPSFAPLGACALAADFWMEKPGGASSLRRPPREMLPPSERSARQASQFAGPGPEGPPELKKALSVSWSVHGRIDADADGVVRGDASEATFDDDAGGASRDSSAHGSDGKPAVSNQYRNAREKRTSGGARALLFGKTRKELSTSSLVNVKTAEDDDIWASATAEDSSQVEFPPDKRMIPIFDPFNRHRLIWDGSMMARGRGRSERAGFVQRESSGCARPPRPREARPREDGGPEGDPRRRASETSDRGAGRASLSLRVSERPLAPASYCS